MEGGQLGKDRPCLEVEMPTVKTHPCGAALFFVYFCFVSIKVIVVLHGKEKRVEEGREETTPARHSMELCIFIWEEYE